MNTGVNEHRKLPLQIRYRPSTLYKYNNIGFIPIKYNISNAFPNPLFEEIIKLI